jgi:hypothetical protein
MESKISEKIMPLLEPVRELAGDSKKGDFQETYLRDFSTFTIPFMLDIPIYLNINKSTSDTVSAFINKFKSNPSLKVEYYTKLSANKNIIPVLSYDSRSNYIQGSFKTDLMLLKKSFNRVAFRIFNTKDFQLMLNDIKDVISAEDILIYDLDTKLHNQPKIITNYNKINALKDSINFTSVLVRSAINREVVFKDLTNGAIVSKANNSLLYDYSTLGFNAFGDYCGIRKDRSISRGGSGKASAGYLFYSRSINSYIGFKGRYPKWEEFCDYIKSTIKLSPYWDLYSNDHHLNCPGCKNISSTLSNHSYDWKKYAILHYLYTMEEYL